MEESLTKVSRYDAQWGITTRVEKSRVLQKKSVSLKIWQISKS